MAKPIDPARWNEFAIKGAAGAPEMAAGSAATHPDEERVQAVYRDLSAVRANAVHDPMPLAAVAALIIGLAAGSISDNGGASVETDFQGELGSPKSQRKSGQDVGPFELGSVRFGVDGTPDVPPGALISGESLVVLLKALVGDRAVPAAVAKLLLVQPYPTPAEIADSLSSLAVPEALRDYLGAESQPAVDLEAAPQTTAATSAQEPHSPRAHRHAQQTAYRGAPPIARDSLPSSKNGRKLPISSRVGIGGLGRRRRIGLAAVAVLGVGFLMFLMVSPSDDPDASAQATTLPEPTAVSASPSTHNPAPTSWVAYLRELDSVRAEAFATDSGETLDGVNAPDSPAYRRDLSALEGLRSAAVVAQGLRTTVDRVEVLEQTAQRARLLVADSREPYRIVSKGTGTVVEKRPAASSGLWVVTLTDVDGRWLIHDVVAGSA